ncbi:HlyD family secretion protein [Microvirga subterranea]|uniref:HlyD family secretion protein n=1 Tax=Microvirga subterranea TaxID=186651 RepID=A0A370HVF7_9HYPH|nr:HlyD family efflux transporter periplasmic adaptor subunit [Microvirga subterranea]RDI62395.1 HlyD family secretion protein [Microvirga subterranea]
MKRALLIGLAVILAAGGFGAWYLLRPKGTVQGYQGYVEGYLVFMAPEDGGRIETLSVDSADQVKKGDALFVLESSTQLAQRNEADAKLQQARAELADLQAALQRPEQIAILRAQEERAKAQLSLSQTELDRQRTLYERGIAAKAQYDQARTAFDRDKAALEEVQRQIEAGRIAARSATIEAAEAAVNAAEAGLNQAETRLAKRRVAAPADAQVQDVFFRAGETVNAGQPVLSLLPPENRRIRFYVPEPKLATVALGQEVAVTCDSCQPGLRARISFIAREAEFTPPVIFSQEERAKLVFRIEAKPADGANLPIGLPVTVLPLGE